MAKQLICSACGHVGGGQSKIKGNGFIELILWLCFLIPGIIYSIWRSSSRYKACPSCGSTNLIPIDSPVGKKLLTDQGKTLEEVVAEQKGNAGTNVTMRLVIFAILGILLISIFTSIV